MQSAPTVTLSRRALTLAWDGWLDHGGQPPTLVEDLTAPGGGLVAAVSRTASGGDYSSPWQPVSSGQSYCVQAAVKWVGGGAPFIGFEPSTGSTPIWIIGSAGYADQYGPVTAVSPTEAGWQQLAHTVVVPDGATQARLSVELWAPAGKGEDDLAYFGRLVITEGACIVAPPPSYSIPYLEELEAGTGGWLDRAGIAPGLTSDATSPAGPSVMALSRTAAGGDYASPAITVTGGQTACVSVAVRWLGGGAPFVAVQTSDAATPIWIIGSAGYGDQFGPVTVVSATEAGWQQLQHTVVMPADATQARLWVELWAPGGKGGADLAYFDRMAITDGACVVPPPPSYTIPYVEELEAGTGGWLDRTGTAPSLTTDPTSPAGASVMALSRTAAGGDYSSPALTVTGGQTACVSVAVKWLGGGAPFVAVQTSDGATPIWIIGSAGYGDQYGPVTAVSPSEAGWQQLQHTVVLPAEATQARLWVELWAPGGKAGADLAYFDRLAVTDGACVVPPPPTHVLPYLEELEAGTGGWLDRAGVAPSLATDATSPAGPSVMALSRTAAGGDYASPLLTVTGGQTVCVQVAVKWLGGGAPFVAVQASDGATPIWIIGSAGYGDQYGPVTAVSPSETGWQQLQHTVVMPAEATQARLWVELWAPGGKAGTDLAYFDGIRMVAGACPPPDLCATDHGGCDPLVTCTSGPDGRVCGPCPDGYTGTGDTACVDIDECLAAPCQHGGSCLNAPGGYTCQCLDGWGGANCETAVPIPLLAAGDIGDCGTPTTASATASLADLYPGTIAVLGDTDQMTGGALSEYMSCFEAPWGRHKARIRPVPGNHDYMGVGPSGYFDYYGAVAGTPQASYYSYNLGAWHIVALDDNCATSTVPGGCAAGSAQEQWLRQDLAANASLCTLAYFHQPRYSSGQHGNTAAASPLWQALLDFGVEVALSGHDHGYERWAAQDDAGNAVASGIVQFVVGTGGTDLRTFSSTKPANSAVRDSSSHGILKLSLHSEGYDWQFVPVEGKTFTDAGSGGCHVSCPPGYQIVGVGCVDIDECLTGNGGCDPLTTCTNIPGGRTCGPCPAGYTGTGETGCVPASVKEELVGLPTDHGVTITAVADVSLEATIEYGVASGVYTGTNPAPVGADGMLKAVLDGLAADTRYYYRVRYRPVGSTVEPLAGAEHTFHTQRAAGSTFSFAVKSDSHQGYTSSQFWDEALYRVTMANIAADQPDLLFDLGDAVSTDDATETEASVRAKYANQRTSHAIAGHSTPVFLALGNHENEEGWNLDDFGANVSSSLPVLGVNARKRYFSNPVPDAFYSGNTDATKTAVEGDHLLADYYAFTWGDALFVVIDPFWYTLRKPYAGSMGGEKNDEVVGNRWDWTLGDQQYQWLATTLASSTAKFKFVFAHHATGGMDDYIRGGANGAKYCEWGGFDTNGTSWAFENHRPGWAMPIHQLFVATGVSAFFHGHDHVYAYEQLDGVAYQEVPFSASPAYGTGFTDNATYYAGSKSGLVNNSGHVRVTVRPAAATSRVLVEYVRAFLPGAGDNRHVEHTYTIAPCEERGDSDGDLTNDCDDRCPTNAGKVAPGQCGCAMADTDTDGDGTADCRDGCPSDPAKTAPGLCGCGHSDTGDCPSFAVVRVGDGSGSLSTTSTAVFLEQRNLADGSLRNTIPLPTAATDANRPLTLSGSAPAEGGLKRTVDGRYLVLAGYATGTGKASVAQTDANTLNRVVARIAADGTIDTTTTVNNAFNGASGTNGNVRGVTSSDGSAFWIAGYGTSTSGGIWYAGIGATTATQVIGKGGLTSPINMRNATLFADRLYATGTNLTGTTPTWQGVFAVGDTPPPTTESSAAVPSGFPTATSKSFDLVVLADAIYVSDERTDVNGGIQKWTTDGTTWTLAYTLRTALPSSTGVRHIFAVPGASGVQLYGVTTASPTTLVTVTDTGSASSFSTLATAGANTAFRGVAPWPAP